MGVWHPNKDDKVMVANHMGHEKMPAHLDVHPKDVSLVPLPGMVLAMFLHYMRTVCTLQ